MRKATCPKCQIPSLYIKNSSGDTLQGYDTETIYCFGCSWSGSTASLIRR